MRWRRGVFPQCLFVAAVSVTLFLPSSCVGAPVYTKPAFDEKECEEALSCHVCSTDEKLEVRECASSGKIQTLSCPLDNGGTYARTLCVCVCVCVQWTSQTLENTIPSMRLPSHKVA